MIYASLLALDSYNQIKPDNIAKISGYSVRTVYRALRELAGYGAIKRSYGYIDILQWKETSLELSILTSKFI